jgi:hypothetical protein
LSAITFDKLAYIDALSNGGFSPEQARVHANALDNALRDTVATKDDVINNIAMVRKDMELLEQRITIKMGAMIIALGGFLTAIKFFS